MENVKFEIVKGLCRINGLSLSQVEQRLGFSNGQLGKWKKRVPKIDRASEVADYFNVSLDYLFGREEKEILIKQEGNESENVSDDMVEVMEKMQGMIKEERRKVRDIVNVLDKK